MELNLSKIRPGRYQPRQHFNPEEMLSLAQSIEEQGLITPITVFRTHKDSPYELIAGERRWRASCAIAIAADPDNRMNLKAAVYMVCKDGGGKSFIEKWGGTIGQHTIRTNPPAPSESLQDIHLASVIENIQRSNLSPYEEGKAIKKLQDDYGYSIRKVAEVIGKTKSYTDDRLQLVKLLPAVGAMTNPTSNGNGSGRPQLDLSLARELARKVRPEHQKYLAEYLKKQQANKVPAKDLLRLIRNIARFSDSNRWSLSDNSLPYAPFRRNWARHIKFLLENTPPERLIAALVKLHPSGYLSKKVTTLLKDDWEYGPIVMGLSGKRSENSWADVAQARSWTCGHCVLNVLVGSFTDEERVGHLDNSTYCDQFDNKLGKVRTCINFIGLQDPQIIIVPDSIVSRTKSDDLKDLLNGPMCGDTSYNKNMYAKSWQDYVLLYMAAATKYKEEETAVAEKKKNGHIEPIRLYMEVQKNTLPDGKRKLNLTHFYANTCSKCAWYKDENCQYTLQPIVENDRPRSPHFAFLVDADGNAIPRCEMFTLRDKPEIKVIEPGFSIPNRQIFYGWVKRLMGRYNHCGARHTFWNGEGSWLGPNFKEVMDISLKIYSDDEVIQVLRSIVAESSYTKSFEETVNLIDPTGFNDLTGLEVMQLSGLTEKRVPYGWDGPVPWYVGNEKPSESKVEEDMEETELTCYLCDKKVFRSTNASQLVKLYCDCGKYWFDEDNYKKNKSDHETSVELPTIRR